jgi:hypothetical protein
LKEELSKQAQTPSASPGSVPSAPVAAPLSNGGLLQTPLLSNLPPAQTSAPAKPSANSPGTKTNK